ncbi:MAG: phycobilisome linker polypeptide [Leptolyngbya sp. SIO4C1]|nr:phycobilisome linker polypeptide [Leptolyngbya sp. SIO4C1]
MTPVELPPIYSSADVDMVIRAVYRQVLGNAHVMESERLTVPESLFRQGDSSVREFVRQVAKSELYRSRFFHNCYRYRSIELNFKHLLGRAPQSFEEMQFHSHILDTQGFGADIDTFIDSNEYIGMFGETIVPYYRGYKTEPGQSMLEFTNMLQLLDSASSSDKSARDNRPRLTRALILNRPYGLEAPTDTQALMTKALSQPSTRSAEQAVKSESRAQPLEAQRQQIQSLQRQLADLKPFANIGAAVTRHSQQVPLAVSGAANGGQSAQNEYEQQAREIERLQGELAEARSLATIGEARLNKWRRRFS